MDKLTPEQRKKNMRAVKSKGSKIEETLAKQLWNQGIRYRKNNKSIFGTPDLTIKKFKIAIFCDGEFWHGKDWEIRKHDHKTNQDFWIHKIEKNMQRDLLVNERLKQEGWTVIRFWGKDILKNSLECVDTIKRHMTKKNNFDKSISLSNILKDKKKGVQIFGSSSLNEDGSIMSFNEQLAVISHYIHNNNTNFGAPYEDKALDLMDDITKFISNSEIKNSLSNDPSIQYNLFNEFNEIPFPSQPQPKFTFIDLFAGIGGFRQAMQNLGGKCVFSSEWDEQAQKTYMLNYGEVPFGDITLEQTKQYIPDHFDILCAGFPCQAFSLAGKRLGFEETRGTLFFDVAEIIRRKQPRAFFLENVKGLKIHDKGKTLEVILRTLREDLGYYVPDPEVMNAKDFGVPQNRERIFIVGFHSETGITEFSYPKPSNKKVSIADIKEKDVVPSKYYLSTQYLQTLREHKARHANKGNGFGYEIIEDTDIANAIVVGGMGRERNLIIDHRLTDFTPTTRIKGEVNREGIRKMTPREWARLQGFPDNFIIGVADASAYKQFGNSVAVPAIQATASKIIEKIL